VSTVGMRGNGMVPVAYCPVQRTSVSEEHEFHAMMTCKVGLAELVPIREGV
jgi:hypothetical protein